MCERKHTELCTYDTLETLFNIISFHRSTDAILIYKYRINGFLLSSIFPDVDVYLSRNKYCTQFYNPQNSVLQFSVISVYISITFNHGSIMYTNLCNSYTS